MSQHCAAVFDIATAGYTAWPLVAVGSTVTVIIVVICILVSRARRLPQTIWITPILAGTLTIGFFIATWIDYRNARIARTTGQCDAIEGPIHDFVPVGRSFWQYSPGPEPYNSRWLTRGWGWEAPYEPGVQAAEKLSLPEWNSGVTVREVPNSWNSYVAGPRPVTADFGRAGGGVEYSVGGFR